MMKFNALRIGALLLCCSVNTGSATAQDRQAAAKKTPPDTLTLKRVYSNEFRERTHSAFWLEDGRYARRDRAAGPNGGQDLVAYDPATLEKEVLLRAERLFPTVRSAPIGLNGLAFSEDMSKVLIYANTKRVWRQNTRGDYWVLDRTSHELKQLGAGLPASTMMFAKFSPDGKQVAFVHNNDLWVESSTLPTGPRRLTYDGSEHTINGTFDWVYEEELGLRDGFRWSPDGSTIAFWQLDSTGVRKFPLVNNTKGLYPTIQWIPYPKTGQQNSASRIGLLAVPPMVGENAAADTPAPAPVKWLKIPGDPRNNYLARMQWQPDSHILYIQQLNRLQNHNRVYRVDGHSTASSVVLEERDDAWVELQRELTWIGDSFIWLSERSGTRQIYLFDTAQAELRLVTESFEADVISIVRATKEHVYFIASPKNATQQYLYRISLAPGGVAKRLTPADQSGWHHYDISPNGEWAFHRWSQFDQPSTTELIRLSNDEHQSVHVLEDNKLLQSKLAKLGKRRPVTELFQVEIEPGVSLDAWCIRPAKLEKGKRYPLLVYVYGEPAGTTVRDRWGGTTQMWHRMLAQQGYVVMSFDNRGTPAPKGREWRKCVYRQVGILAPKDQAAAVRAVLEKRDYLDPDRVGVWGWSGGGSMTLNALFKFPKLYRMGVSIAPVPNQRLYDTIYQERYMGLPSDNAQGYHDGSPLNFASQLEGDLLLIHGTGDDNCHYQGAEALVNELIRYNKPFRMMAYPNRSHSISEGANTTRHLRQLMTDYIHQKLPAGPQ